MSSKIKISVSRMTTVAVIVAEFVLFAIGYPHNSQNRNKANGDLNKESYIIARKGWIIETT